MQEQDIILGCKRREQTAYKALVDKYSKYLFAVCKRYVGDDENAKDCLQESLIQIITKIDLYEERGKFLSWMSAVTVKKCLDFIRREKRFLVSDIDDALDPVQSESVSFKLERDEVMAFLDTLPVHYRIAINMYLVEGYSHKEIADELGINESSSRSLVSRGRKMIIDAFEEDPIARTMKQNSQGEGEYKLKIIRS